uniref:RRM domain-containing protein n=1 Tax=Oryza barthii TaxID=65489 RepID=A0A0D3G2P4_9ORYZ
MAPPEKGAAAHGAVAKNGGEGEVSAVRRPGRPRVVHPDVAEFLLNFRRLRREKKKRATPRPAVVVVPGERASAHAMPALTASVDAALGEVARRVAAGLSCCCCCDGAAVAKKQVIENAGIREGAHGATVDAAFTRGALRGEAFVGYVSALAVAPLAGADRLDLAIATAQLKAFDRWRGAAARSLPEYTCHHGIEANAMAPRRKRGRATKNTITGNVDDDASELENFEPTPQPLSHQMSTKIGKLMSRAAQQMSRSPAVIHRDTTTTTTNGDAPPPPPPAISLTMGRCTRSADEKKKNSDIREDPFLAGLVLNFICPSAVLPLSELVNIFSKFGPIMEAKTENAYAMVMFKRRADAEAAFSGTTKINALSSSLISFRLNYSMSASPIDSPECSLNTAMDRLLFCAVQFDETTYSGLFW